MNTINIMRNKYNATKTKYNGRVYDSKKEAEYAQILDFRILGKEIKQVIPQYKISLQVHGEHVCYYIIDFKIILNCGRIEYHEVKGYETKLWKLKWKIFKIMLKHKEPKSVIKLIK